MTARIAGQSAGVLHGAADAARGTKHQARAWSAEQHPNDREATARERWHAGLPARNAFERDVYDHIEASIAVDHPARQSARNDPEAGQ